ncbi:MULTISPECIES: MaoC/PaaZ C-terminal domain-containing protein [Ktedonobacter]|uniref:MaoC family dehydratase n=1 Tax=Ktedonobacter robiniae TaxID=2778365 RepID=A0ABQ3UFW8_9CHLR|nr:MULTISPECIES: MaoC/PaaZ C-terminal domain-containing protein [Ktedonobacter]GHO51611.1 MaoC family dehydratase [Ktedonobacter robiniae]GHO64965.1 MaoC family dehydratase [Ktedonobacter sp. SOSP1-52]
MTTSNHTWLYAEDAHEGDSLPPLTTQPVTHLQLVRYAGASGDFNPLHTDPAVGQAIGTGGIIAHGMLIMGFVGQMLSDAFGPLALRKFGVRFKGMTRIGDVITCTGKITEINDVEGETRATGSVQAVDQNGDIKVSGTFSAALPRRQP